MARSTNRSDIVQYLRKHSVIPYIYTAIAMMKQLGFLKQLLKLMFTQCACLYIVSVSIMTFTCFNNICYTDFNYYLFTGNTTVIFHSRESALLLNFVFCDSWLTMAVRWCSQCAGCLGGHTQYVTLCGEYVGRWIHYHMENLTHLI